MATQTDPLMEQQRRLAFERLQELRNFYSNPEAQLLQQQIAQRASGEDAPYSPTVTNAMFADSADASAGRVANDSEMIRRAFANAGMGGSGLEASALVNTRRQAGKATRADRRNITSRAALQNFQAKAAAQQQAQNYLQQRQLAEQQAGMAEVDLRSQMQNVQDQAASTQATADEQARIEQLRQKYSGQNPFMKQLNSLGGVQATGFSSNMGVKSPNMWGFGGSGGYTSKDAAHQAYMNKQTNLRQQASEWDAQASQLRSKYGF